MKLKKILFLVLAAVMVLGLAACDNGAANPTATPSADASPSASQDPAASPSDTTDEGGKLIMATNAAFPPYEYYEGGEIVGIDAEVAAKIAEKLGMTLEISDMEFNSIIPALQSNKADIGMAGMTVNEDRLKNVDFTTSYATGVQVVILTEDSPIKSLEDLQGKKIGVQESTTGDIYASDTPENGGFGEENVARFSKGADAVLALTQGKVDAVIIDNEPAKVFVKQTEGLKILETEYVVEDYAIAVNKGNTEMLEKVDTALKELIEDGTVKSIIDKYITAD